MWNTRHANIPIDVLPILDDVLPILDDVLPILDDVLPVLDDILPILDDVLVIYIYGIYYIQSSIAQRFTFFMPT